MKLCSYHTLKHMDECIVSELASLKRDLYLDEDWKKLKPMCRDEDPILMDVGVFIQMDAMSMDSLLEWLAEMSSQNYANRVYSQIIKSSQPYNIACKIVRQEIYNLMFY